MVQILLGHVCFSQVKTTSFHCWYRRDFSQILNSFICTTWLQPELCSRHPCSTRYLSNPVTQLSHLSTSIFLSSLIYHIITWHCLLYQINNSLNLLPQLPTNQCSVFPVGMSAVSSNLLPFDNLCPPLAQIQHSCPEKPHSYTFPPSWVKPNIIPSFPSGEGVFLTTSSHMLLKHLQ